MSRNYIDYKTTFWSRMYLKGAVDVDKIVKQLEGKEISTLNDIMVEVINWDDVYDDEDELLYDTQEEITVEENDGNATIEVYKNQSIVWSNQQKNIS